MLTDWAVNKLQSLLLDYVTIDCAGHACFGFAAVHRINFALGLFHCVLAILLIGVTTSKDSRAAIQNGFWGPKLVVWLGLIVLSFLIPNTFFEVWGNYVALVGAILFLLLGLVLLVDLAHTFAEFCIEKIEDTDSGLWRGVLIGSTLGMYLGSFAMIIVMYIFFAGSGCSMNQAAITVRIKMRSSVGQRLTFIGQPDILDRDQRYVHPSEHSGDKLTSWSCTVRDGVHLLHLPHYECSCHGAR